MPLSDWIYFSFPYRFLFFSWYREGGGRRGADGGEPLPLRAFQGPDAVAELSAPLGFSLAGPEADHPAGGGADRVQHHHHHHHHQQQQQQQQQQHWQPLTPRVLHSSNESPLIFLKFSFFDDICLVLPHFFDRSFIVQSNSFRTPSHFPILFLCCANLTHSNPVLLSLYRLFV